MDGIREEIERAFDVRGRRVLFGYALQRIGGYSGDKDDLAADLVSEAVQRVLSGKRKWNKDATEDALDYLCSVVKSLISALRKKHPELFTRTFNWEDAESLGLLKPVELRMEDVLDLETFCTELMGDLNGDTLLQTVFERIVFQGEEPGVVAAELGVPVSDVYAARKRLNRKIQTVRERREMSTV